MRSLCIIHFGLADMRLVQQSLANMKVEKRHVCVNTIRL